MHISQEATGCPHYRMGKGPSQHHHRIYYIDCAEYADLSARGTCWLCPKTANDGPALRIDHDHRRIWAVRGLLCVRCNGQLIGVDRGRREPAMKQRTYLSDPWWARQPEQAPRIAREYRDLIQDGPELGYGRTFDPLTIEARWLTTSVRP